MEPRVRKPNVAIEMRIPQWSTRFLTVFAKVGCSQTIELQRFSLEWYTLELGKILTSCGNDESILP